MEPCLTRLFKLLLASCTLLESAQGRFILGCNTQKRDTWRRTGWPTELDYGLYWWGKDDTLEKATPQGSRLYDPSKPTVIDIHGWVGFMEWTKACFRTTPHCDICGDKRSLFKAWFDKGWNVGIFYWDQFADEPKPCDAEKKIYLHHEHLRWLSNSPEKGPNYFARMKFKEFPQISSNTSVADLAVQNIAAVMHDYVGPEVRMIGHSMGTHLAIRCSTLLHQMKSPAAPSRLVLTEAAFVPAHLCGNDEVGGKSYSDFVVELLRANMRELAALGVFLEYVQTLKGHWRIKIDGKTSKELQASSVSVRYTPDWCHNNRTKGIAHYVPFLCTHDAAHALYMLSMSNDGPCNTPTAACSVSDVASLVSKAQSDEGGRHPQWIQIGGTKTIHTADDRFNLTFHTEESDAVTQLYATLLARQSGSDSGKKILDIMTQRPVIITLAAVVAVSCLFFILFFWSKRTSIRKKLCTRTLQAKYAEIAEPLPEAYS